MEYRVNRRTGDRISVLGVGTSGLPAAGAKEGAATLETVSYTHLTLPTKLEV